jgi:hypothetical protein
LYTVHEFDYMTELLTPSTAAAPHNEIVSAAQALVDAARGRLVKGDMETEQAGPDIQRITLRPTGKPDEILQIVARVTDNPDGDLWVRRVADDHGRQKYTNIELPRTANVTPDNVGHLTAEKARIGVQGLWELTAQVSQAVPASKKEFVIPHEPYRKSPEHDRSPKKVLETAGARVVSLFDRARTAASTYRSAARPAA